MLLSRSPSIAQRPLWRPGAGADGARPRPWAIHAKDPRGLIRWRGWFHDRDECDLFLWALASGDLVRDRYVRELPSPAWCPSLLDLPLVYEFTIVVGNLGTASAAGTSASITGATVPSGAMILVETCSHPGGGSFSYSDSGADVFNSIYTVGFGTGEAYAASLAFCINSGGFTSGSVTGVYSPGSSLCVSAFWATGCRQVGQPDAAVTATSSSSSMTPTVTSGVPTLANELFVAAAFVQAAAAFTQDSADGWASPFAAVAQSTTLSLAGGNQTAGGGAITFSPSFGSVSNVVLVVAGFFPQPTPGPPYNQAMAFQPIQAQ